MINNQVYVEGKNMSNRKIDRIKLNKMLRTGKSQKQIASHFGVSPAAICKAAKELNAGVSRSVALEDAHRVVSKNLDAVAQLAGINAKANEILESAMGVIRGEQEPDEDMPRNPQELALKSMQEIRGQLKLQLELFQMLYDVKAVQEFQTEVLTAIGEESPETRERIIHRLKVAKALRTSVKITK